jgi:hypothetical protein
MKKLVLLGLLLLISAVVVSAEYTIAVPTKVYPQQVEDCWSICKKVCDEQKMSGDECEKYCVQKCQPPIMVQRAIKPLPPEPMPEDCPSMCKRLAAQADMTAASLRAGFNVELFVRCMHDRCKEDCESSCRTMFGAQAMDCIEKFCKPETCEHRCNVLEKECLGMGGDDESCTLKRKDCIRRCYPEEPCGVECRKMFAECEQGPMMVDCKVMFHKCMKEKCGEPESCEGQCEQKIRAMCKEQNLDEYTCKMHVRDCIQKKCKPECPACPGCPEYPCEMRCAKGYYTCSEIARTMKAKAGKPEDVQEEYLRRCRLDTAECLEQCRPAEPERYLKKMPQTEPQKPECREICARRHKECMDSGVEPIKCDEDLKNCARMCEPIPGRAAEAKIPSEEEMRGLNPQPEPPKPVGFWARIKALFAGG